MPGIVYVDNKTRALISPITAYFATSLWDKFKGLMLRRELREFEGLILAESHESRIETAIHMLFMNFDITAVWIDAAYRVVDVKLAKRWHLSYTPPRPAQFVLECHTKRYNDFQSGDELFFTDAK